MHRIASKPSLASATTSRSSLTCQQCFETFPEQLVIFCDDGLQFSLHVSAPSCCFDACSPGFIHLYSKTLSL